MKKFLIMFIIILFVTYPNVIFAGGSDSDSTSSPSQDYGCLYQGTNDDGSKFKVFVRIYDSDAVYIQP